jgi:RNA recognition motif-containing protein
MDKIAKRPKGFAFIRYETEEEAQKAIEGMHGKVCSTYHFLRKL